MNYPDSLDLNGDTATRQVLGSILDMGAVTYRLSKAHDAQTKAGNRPPPLLSLKYHDLQTDGQTKSGRQPDR